MRHIVIAAMLVLCMMFIGNVTWGQIPLHITDEVDLPDSFDLIEPANGSGFTLTSPIDSVVFAWEDVLGLGNESENNASTARDFSIPLGMQLLSDNDDEDPFEELLPEEYYSVLVGLDPDLQLAFPLPWDEPGFVANGLHFGIIQYMIQLLFEEPVETVSLFWTIGATNEAGTTWANDTFYVSYEIDNNPPRSEFDLMTPAHGATIEIKGDQDSGTPLPDDITFEWEATTDPDGDDVFYWWVASNVYPIPPILDLLDEAEDDVVFSQNSFMKTLKKNSDARVLTKQSQNEADTLIIILPSGDFTFLREFLEEDIDDNFDDEFEIDPEDLEFIFEMLIWMLSGGGDTSIIIPSEIFYLMMLEELETQVMTMYWTTIASDGFSFLHWTPSPDTSAVTMEITFVSDVKQTAGMPAEYFLRQNYPNPFNPATTIDYGIKSDSHVELHIYNMLGQQVMEVVNEYQQAGEYSVTLDASWLSSGVYFYTIRAGGDFMEKRRMVLIK